MSLSARVGECVHVQVHDHLGVTCRPALVIVGGIGSVARLRVIHPTPVGAPIGRDDAEAWYRGDAHTFANPDGTTREGDTWHRLTDCPTGA